jgi:hypothetical protein
MIPLRLDKYAEGIEKKPKAYVVGKSIKIHGG